MSPSSSSADLMGALKRAQAETRNLYLVELQFEDRVLGTQPRSADILMKWLQGKLTKEGHDEKTAQDIAQSHVDRVAEHVADNLEAQLEEESEAAWTTFFHDALGPWMGTYQTKACIREMLTSLGITVAKRGSKQTFQHLLEIRACDANGVPFDGVRGKRLHFYNGDAVTPIPEPEGFVEMTASVSTPQGQRSIIKRHDYVRGATIRFLLGVPARLPKARSTAALRDQDIALVLAHAGNNGLGCSRSQGYGTFVVTRLERLTDHPVVLGKEKKDKKDK